MRFKIAFVLLLMAGRTGAQGLVFNDDAYNNLSHISPVVSGTKDVDALLKNTFKVDLKPYCPTVQAQGRVSSCVGWSVGYAAMTIENAILNGWGGDQRTIDEHAYSAMYLYNQIKLGDCSFGAELNEAFEILKRQGNVLHRDFAVGNNCDSLPPPTLIQKARSNRVNGFAALFAPEDKEAVKVERVKLSLARRKPVVIGMIVLENFLSLKSGDDVWYPNVGKTDLFGGHAMVVVGFDDGRKAFEVMNSWGQGWANRGFVWVRYSDFAKYCKYAYELDLKDHGNEFLEGTIRARKPTVTFASGGNPEVAFSPLAFQEGDHGGRLLIDATELPFEFQLVVEDLVKESYLYVISFDRDLKSMVHWPRDEKLGRHFAGEHDTPLIHNTHVPVTLPGKFNVFRLIEPGTEYLCVLNSRNALRNLPDRLKQIRTMKGELPARIQHAFHAQSAGAGRTDPDAITFSEGKSQEAAVFVLLEISVSTVRP